MPIKILEFREKDKKYNVGIIQNRERLPIVETYQRLADINERMGTGMRLLSPQLASRMLGQGTLRWQDFVECSPFMLNCMVGYPRNFENLRSTVSFNYALEATLYAVTGAYYGKWGAVIFKNLNPDNFKKEGEDTMRLEVAEANMILNRQFPQSIGNYRVDEETGIPYGERFGGPFSEHPPGTICLYRMEGQYLGPLHMNTKDEEDARRLYACAYPSQRFGMVLEISDSDVKTIKQRAVYHQMLKLTGT